MSLKDLLDKQDAAKKAEKSSFKLNLQGSDSAAAPSLPKEETSGEENSLANLFGNGPPVAENEKAIPPQPVEVEEKSSPLVLPDINHESQPEEFDEQTIRQFKAALQTLSDHISDKDIVSDAIRNVLGMLKEHDFLKKLLLPEHGQLMVRALRESYGVVIQKKQTKRTKRQQNSEAVDKVLEDLAEFDIGSIE